MEFIGILLVAGAVFGICYAVDKAFTKMFRNKAQHRSGLAVRASKKYGIFGVVLTVLGVLSVMVGAKGDKILLFGGIFVGLMGLALAAYYLGFGIFYDGESFLVCALGKKSREYRYDQIKRQLLFIVQGGNTVIELHMKDGSAVSLQSGMDGVYPFLDTAFAGWCMETGTNPQDCSFYDPANSWWFPHDES